MEAIPMCLLLNRSYSDQNSIAYPCVVLDRITVVYLTLKFDISYP